MTDWPTQSGMDGEEQHPPGRRAGLDRRHQCPRVEGDAASNALIGQSLEHRVRIGCCLDVEGGDVRPGRYKGIDFSSGSIITTRTSMTNRSRSAARTGGPTSSADRTRLHETHVDQLHAGAGQPVQIVGEVEEVGTHDADAQRRRGDAAG
jgi:hypothetical protein